MMAGVSHQRIKRSPRCPGCGLLPGTCVCSRLPSLRFATPVAIVQHARERHKPTNTGRLFARMVDGTRMMTVGLRGQPFDPSPLRDPHIEWTLLYPRQGAPILDAGVPVAPGKRAGYVLLDGTWSQCAHMSRRLDVVADLPCAALPPGPPSFWSVRTQHRPEGRSTFDAALQVLEMREGAPAVEPLRRAFAMLTARMLHLKGKLSSPEIPASWGV